MSPVPADAFEEDNCTSIVEVRGEEDVDVGFSNLYYFFQNRHAFSQIATDDPENPEDVVTIPQSAVSGAWVPDTDSERGAGLPVGIMYEYSWRAEDGNSTFQSRTTDGNVMTIGGTLIPEGYELSTLFFWQLSQTLYGIMTDCEGSNTLGEVNTETAEFSPIAEIEGAECIVSADVLPNGDVVVLDNGHGSLGRFAMAEHIVSTFAEPLGYNAGYMQAIAYSFMMNRLLIAAVHAPTRGDVDLRNNSCGRGGSPEGQLRLADVDEEGNLTGATTLIGLISPNGRAQTMYYTFPRPDNVSNEPEAGVPATYELSAIFPNPIMQESALLLELANEEFVAIHVFDSLGRLVTTLHEGMLARGISHRFGIDLQNLASGIYLVHVRGESFTATRRAVMIRQ